MKASVEQDWFSRDSGTYQEGLAATVKGREHVNTLSKTYFVSFRGIGAVAGGDLPHEEYMNLPALNHHAPLSIAKDEQLDVPIRMSDNVQAALDQGKGPVATANIFMFGDPESVTVAMNGNTLATRASENRHADLYPDRTEHLLHSDIPVELIRVGENVFTFVAQQEMMLLDLWVDLDYPSSK